MLLEFLRQIKEQQNEESVGQEETKKEIDFKSEITSLQEIRKTNYKVEDLLPKTQKPQIPCGICNEATSSYKCPKCTTPYCSLKCYKAHNQGKCVQIFSQQQVEANLKADRVTDQKKINEMQKVLYKNMRGEEEDKDETSETINTVGVISDERLQDLLGKLELDQSEDLTLTQDETRLFEAFVRKENNAIPSIKEWLPWWLSKTNEKPTNIDIQEMMASGTIVNDDINLNSFMEYLDDELPHLEEESKQDVESGEYVDLEIIDLGKIQEQAAQLYQKYQIIKLRYQQNVPQLTQILRSKAPSPQLKYLILSNLLSLCYLYRLYNGEVQNNPEVVQKLVSQLLNQDAQVIVTDVESAYYFFLKSNADANNIDLLKVYEPQILQDIEILISSKVDMIESVLREYDLVHYNEKMIIGKKKVEGLAKQKLIFYMSYIKSMYANEFSSIVEELVGFRSAYIEGKVVSKREMVMKKEETKQPLIQEVSESQNP